MPLFAASEQGLHCLRIILKGISGLKNVNIPLDISSQLRRKYLLLINIGYFSIFLGNIHNGYFLESPQ